MLGCAGLGSGTGGQEGWVVAWGLQKVGAQLGGAQHPHTRLATSHGSRPGNATAPTPALLQETPLSLATRLDVPQLQRLFKATLEVRQRAIAEAKEAKKELKESKKGEALGWLGVMPLDSLCRSAQCRVHGAGCMRLMRRASQK